VFSTPSGIFGSCAKARPLTVAGAAQVRIVLENITLLLPVELRHVNHTASTNTRILRTRHKCSPYNRVHMSNQTLIDQIADRVERVLVRYAELQRTNTLLTQQVDTLTQERDSLKSRLNAARARVDALLDKLPQTSASQKDAS